MAYQDNQSPFWSASAAKNDAVAARDEGLRKYMLSIYNLMASALVLTGITAYAGAYVPAVHNLLYVVHENGRMGLSGFGWIVFFAPFLFVMGLSAGINRLSVPAAQGLFWSFAALNGLGLSAIFFAYTGESITRVFLITAIMFCTTGMFGYSTKRDLTSMGHFMMMGVWGLIIASLFALFFPSSALSFAISVVGVIVFTGLIAYDTQTLKSMYYATGGSRDTASRGAIIGALRLYLDFINLFVMLLRLMGDRR